MNIFLSWPSVLFHLWMMEDIDLQEFLLSRHPASALWGRIRLTQSVLHFIKSMLMMFCFIWINCCFFHSGRYHLPCFSYQLFGEHRKLQNASKNIKNAIKRIICNAFFVHFLVCFLILLYFCTRKPMEVIVDNDVANLLQKYFGNSTSEKTDFATFHSTMRNWEKGFCGNKKCPSAMS